MNKGKIITVNGQEYIEYDGSKLEKAIDTDHIIVIAQRGWIFEGRRDKSVKDKLQLLNSNVVRSWENGRGIGGLCKKEFVSEYTLDEVGTVSFPNEGVIAVIDITQW